MNPDSVPDPVTIAGECGHCHQARIVDSDRGSRFYLCQRATDDDRFSRYPRLPMRGCPGHDSTT